MRAYLSFPLLVFLVVAFVLALVLHPAAGGFALAMAAALPTRGRKLAVYRGATPTLIAGVRTKSLKIDGTEIDVTNDDDDAVKKLLDQPGEVSVSISVSGVLKDESLVQEALSTADRVQPTEFRWPGAATEGKLAGDFFLKSFEMGGEYQAHGTFSAEFLSAGAVTFTAAA